MVVALRKGSINAIGIIACSSMQGLMHKQGGEGQGAFWPCRLASTFTLNEPKAAFGYAYNGHTALMARVDGSIAAIVGWNPVDYIGAEVSTQRSTFNGQKYKFTCAGKWYDDSTMHADQTALSLEIECDNLTAKRFRDKMLEMVGRRGLGPDANSTGSAVEFEYTFLPAEMCSEEKPFVGQCAEMALVFLSAWLYEMKNSPQAAELIGEILKLANSQNRSERNLFQGKMMDFIRRWNMSHGAIRSKL